VQAAALDEEPDREQHRERILLAAAIGLLVWPLLRPRGEGVERASIAAAIVAAGLPVIAFILYFAASNWDWHAPAEERPASGPDLNRVIAELQSVRDMLRSEGEAGSSSAARPRCSATIPGPQRFGEANTRTQGRDAEAVVGYAESLILIDERAIDGEATQLFEKALTLAPDNPRALWYGGIVAYRRGDMKLAQQRWVELQNYDLPPDLRQVLAERLAELEKSQGKPAAKSAEATVKGAIEITVSLKPDLAANVPPGSSLFVIARRGSGGPPLAVQRRAVGAWPVSCGFRRGRDAARDVARQRRAAHADRKNLEERPADRCERRPVRRGRL
jgi:cytochrome c-type biogenesis protein CcmH